MQDIIKNIRKRIDDVITGLIDKAKDWFKDERKYPKGKCPNGDLLSEPRQRKKRNDLWMGEYLRGHSRA